jgi:hypothetical protein
LHMCTGVLRGCTDALHMCNEPVDRARFPAYENAEPSHRIRGSLPLDRLAARRFPEKAYPKVGPLTPSNHGVAAPRSQGNDRRSRPFLARSMRRSRKGGAIRNCPAWPRRWRRILGGRSERREQRTSQPPAPAKLLAEPRGAGVARRVAGGNIAAVATVANRVVDRGSGDLAEITRIQAPDRFFRQNQLLRSLLHGCAPVEPRTFLLGRMTLAHSEALPGTGDRSGHLAEISVPRASPWADGRRAVGPWESLRVRRGALACGAGTRAGR